MGGIFELRDYRDLMAKLERDLEAITENPRDSGATFNFFVTAWHLLEWVYPDDVVHGRSNTNLKLLTGRVRHNNNSESGRQPKLKVVSNCIANFKKNKMNVEFSHET